MNLIYLIVYELHKLFVSSYVNFGNLWFTRNWAISSKLSNPCG